MKKISKKLVAFLLILTTMFSLTTTVYASNNNSKKAISSLSFNLNDIAKHEKTIYVDGTPVTFGAEPVVSRGRALSGTWRIYGYNPLVTMEYYITLSASGKYTTISSTHGLAIAGALTSFENETINVVRKTETASNSAIVEGYAKFHYLGNQWVSIWTQSGGVRASIKNDVITSELY